LKLKLEMGLEPIVDAEASAVTASGAGPELGLTLSLAVGGAVAVADVDAVEELPALSVTVTESVKLPPAVYVWLAAAPAWGPTAAEPSPKLKV
jgi:hypothetical protein